MKKKMPHPSRLERIATQKLRGGLSEDDAVAWLLDEFDVTEFMARQCVHMARAVWLADIV